jgi:hypothetical protein
MGYPAWCLHRYNEKQILTFPNDSLTPEMPFLVLNEEIIHKNNRKGLNLIRHNILYKDQTYYIQVFKEIWDMPHDEPFFEEL